MTTSAPLDGLYPPRFPAGHLASAATRRLLRQYVARRVSPADVDDVVQATLCDALAADRAPPEEAEESEVHRWVLSIARFKVVDARRSAARASAADDHELPSPPPPVEAMSLLRWAMRQLPRGTEPTLRWMVREAEGDKLETIAADERLPAACVRQRVSRLRRWMRGRWIAEMALVVGLLLAAAAALRDRHEAILPEIGFANVASDPRLTGSWHLEDFMPAALLSPARQALVDRLSPGMIATFDGRTLRLSSADGGALRTYAVLAQGGRLEAAEAGRDARFEGSYAWVGDDLVITLGSGPWAGVARLRPAR